MSDKKTIGKQVWSLLLKCKKQIFFIHLVYIALGIILFGPLTGLLGQFFLYLAGEEVLADMDILYFLLSPYGVAAVILFSALLIMIIILETATMMIVCALRSLGQNVSTLSALYTTAGQAIKIGSFSLRMVTRLLVLIVPFPAVAGIIATLLISEHDINYYLAETPPVFITALFITGLLLLAMLFFLVGKLVSWALSLPLILFTNISPSQSFERSRQAVSDHRLMIFTAIAFWAGGSSALAVGIFSVIQFTGNYLVPFFYDSINLMVPVLGGLAIIFFIANLLTSALMSGAFASLLVIFFIAFFPDQKMNISGEAAQTDRFQERVPGLATLLAGGVIVSILVGIWLLNDIQSEDKVEIIAHRGAAGKAPENTLAAMHQALEDGTDWLEIDVQESSDGEVVVIHDSDFMKIAGTSLRVWETTLEQMKEIDIGSWFGPEFKDERVPTLSEVLEIARGKAGVVIELKYYGYQEQLEQRVVDIVSKADMVDEISIMSLKRKGVEKLRSLEPEWVTGLLATKAFGNLTAVDVDFLAVNMAMASSGFVKRAHAAGKKVFVWTVNDPVSMSKMISQGIDGIITDEPQMARDLLKERSEMSSIERLLLHTAVILNQPIRTKTYRDLSP